MLTVYLFSFFKLSIPAIDNRESKMGIAIIGYSGIVGDGVGVGEDAVSDIVTVCARAGRLAAYRTADGNYSQLPERRAQPV
jgi:hypothetical protein